MSVDFREPAVSLVVLAHRADQHFVDALESLSRQTFKDFETVVVVNGPASDELEKMASRVDSIRLLVVRAHQGSISELSNIGFEAARGRYVGRFDSDDISDRDRLKRQVAFLELNPEISVLGGQAVAIDDNGQKVGLLSRPISNDQIRRQLPFRCPMLHPTVLMRRTAYLLSGGYRAASHAEDWDLWIRMAEQHELKFANLPEVLVSYRIHGDQTSRQKRNQFRGELSILRIAIRSRYRFEYRIGYFVRILMYIFPSDALQLLRKIFGWWQRRQVD